ncbi:hypothetical protein Peur_019510 [Populus x canadensis]
MEVIFEKKPFFVQDRSYPVECSWDLLLVLITFFAPHVAQDGMLLQPDEDRLNALPYNNVDFDVYKLNFEQQTWEPKSGPKMGEPVQKPILGVGRFAGLNREYSVEYSIGSASAKSGSA